MWTITKDHICEAGEPDASGTSSTDSAGDWRKGEIVQFRLYDDDGELYYTGEIDRDAHDNAEDGAVGSLYEALQWGAYYAGCTDLRTSDGAGGWTSIYG